MRILIIEDDARLARLIRRVLEEEHYTVDLAHNGDSGLDLALTGTYDVAIVDWMLPGLAPTGKPVKVPLVVIVSFREGKLAHEHIYWDQASVLAQLGLLDAEKLPVAGAEAAEKVLDPSLPSNRLMARADG